MNKLFVILLSMILIVVEKSNSQVIEKQHDQTVEEQNDQSPEDPFIQEVEQVNNEEVEKSFGKNAIGLRLGFTGFEASFQTSEFIPNRLEANFGWGWTYNWFNLNFTGIYQFVFPITKPFCWYVGPGIGLGSWQYKGLYPDRYKGGITLCFVANAGAEYNFTDVPFQLSFDVRLKPYLIYNANAKYIDLGVALRYRFGKDKS